MRNINKNDKQQSPSDVIAIIGLGRVGTLVAKYLLQIGSFISVYDEKAQVFQDNVVRQIIQHPNCFVLNDKNVRAMLNQIKFAVCSPGISPQNKVIKIFERKNIPVIDEIDFTSLEINRSALHLRHSSSRKSIMTLNQKSSLSGNDLRLLDIGEKRLLSPTIRRTKLVAITGTNGKSTTTVLLGKILRATGKKTFYGGNLAPGLPFAQALFEPLKYYYVIEVSSFQLERSFYFHPQIAILLNITADHLNRHQTLKRYQEIKFRIFAQQVAKDYAIINAEDNTIMTYIDKVPSRVVYFSRFRKVNGAYLYGSNLYFQGEKICSRNVIKLPGDHYLDCVLAAIAAAKILKVSNESIVKVLKKFRGIEHRLEYVRTIKGVKYINNSMCTNPTAGIAGLNAFTEPIILIAGGAEKKLNVKDYIDAIVNRAKWTVLMGENQKRLAEMLKAKNYFKFSLADSLEEAVRLAKDKAVEGDLILFSPGFASYDAFRDFQERGHMFKTIVNKINSESNSTSKYEK